MATADRVTMAQPIVAVRVSAPGEAQGIGVHTLLDDTFPPQLREGARTVAVIGTGVRKYYPPENRDLHDRIAETGMVLSQFMPDAPPTKTSFPMRNAVMSGYVTATIIVEAGERSGTRIQARNAVEHGRPVLLVDSVVQANTWAQAMQDKPGVQVVSNLADVLAVLEKADDSDAALRRLLDSVIP
jgi:DNA processing protein